MIEEWKRIRGYDYAVSSYGRIKSLERTIIMRNGRTRTIRETIRSPEVVKGYAVIDLYNEKGKRKNYLVHRLVARAFIPNPLKLPQVNHKDEDKLNNRVDNLEWCTASYNLMYGLGASKRNKNHSKTKTKFKYVAYKNGKFFGEFFHKDLKSHGYTQGAVYQAAHNGNLSYGMKWKIIKL
jgi:hypothetical protein